MTPTTIDALLDRYEALLLDSDGVLTSHAGPLPGAAALIERLHREGRPYQVVTNSASRTPASAAARLARWGLPVPADHIVVSGDALPGWFAARDLAGAPTFVLGPADSRAMAAAAGGEVVDDPAAGVLVLADEEGYPFVPTIDAVLTALVQRIDAGRPVHLALPNPDLVYPTGPGSLGLTAGSVAGLIEAVLVQRYGDRAPRFDRLGKPAPALFELALARLGTRDAVMVGDQLHTDVAGALAAGLDAAWIATGVGVARGDAIPTWRLEGLCSSASTRP